MKKIFFYSGLIALATSCTNEFDALDVQNEKAQGISFKTETVDSRMLWEDTGTSYSPFWYAEIDRINIYGAGCLAAGDPASTTSSLTGQNASNGWRHIAPDPFVYKATQSKKNGVFTSLDIDGTWSFAGDKEAAFVATYPTTLTASYTSSKYVDFGGWAPAAIQDQLGVQGDNKAQVMYAFAKATRENSYDAVGETVGLSFVRPLKALVFSTKNADEYTKGATSVFGKLNSITFTTKGITDDGNYTDEGDVEPTALTYSAGATLKVDTTATTEPIITIAETNTPVSKIKLQFNNNTGQEWSDDALAIMAIVPNDRPEYADVEEPAEVVFSFENIDLTHKTFTKISKNVKLNKYMEVPALNIQDYPYLVTKGSSGSARTLIVNGGEDFDFTSIFDAGGDIIWTDEYADAGAVAKENFTKVIVNSDVEITAEGFAKLEAMTTITDLTLKGVTSVPAGALDGLTNLAYLNMPEATAITTTSFVNTNLATVLLPKFDFSVSKSVTESLLNAKQLTTLDMSGVSSMKAAFPNEGFTLDGFASLANLTVKEGLEVGASAFANCTSLNAINAAVNLIGAGAFANTGLTTLAITNTVIPANAFTGTSTLTSVTDKNGAALQPTEVGSNAFVGTKIEYLDLSKTTYIGENAFKDVTAYKGGAHDNDRNLDVLYVGATEIGANAFNGATGLTYVELSNLKNISNGMLAGATRLIEVKFKEILNKPEEALTTSPFEGSMTSTTLFLNQKQTSDFYEGNTFYVNGDAKETGDRVNSVFGRIQLLD